VTDGWVVDYANDRPDLAALKAAGCTGIARYLSMFTTTGKNLDAVEVASCRKLGLSITVVYEDDGGVLGGGPAQGAQRGQQDAIRANQQADQLGIPFDRPVYYAVDTDSLDWGTVADYFRGVRAIPGRPVGGYGQPQLMEHLNDLGLIQWLWCTAAWSGGYRSPRAHLFQRIGTTYAQGVGGDFDENDIKQPDFGQWYPAGGSAQGGNDVFDQQAQDFLRNEIRAVILKDVEDRFNGFRVEVAAEIDAVRKANDAKGNQAIGAVMVGVDSLSKKLAALSPTQASQLLAHANEVADLGLAGVKPGEKVA